jgi:hypothetical protein
MLTRPITVAETAVFLRQVAEIWTDDERGAFVDFIARNPEAGDLVPQSLGVRTVRWGRRGIGKRGGVRVIYFLSQRRNAALPADDLCKSPAR